MQQEYQPQKTANEKRKIIIEKKKQSSLEFKEWPPIKSSWLSLKHEEERENLQLLEFEETIAFKIIFVTLLPSWRIWKTIRPFSSILINEPQTLSHT